MELRFAAVKFQGQMPPGRRDRFYFLYRLRSILYVINNLENLLAAHGQLRSLQQTGDLIQF